MSVNVNTIPEQAALILSNNADLIAKIDDMRKDMEARFDRQICDVANDVKKIELRQCTMDEKLEEIDRKSHLTDLLLNGVPIVPQEDLRRIFSVISHKIGFLSNENTLSSIFRLRNNNQSDHPTIVLKFLTTTARNDFFRLYMKCLDLNLKDIGFETGLRIYIKESLTKRNAEIFRKAIIAKKAAQVFNVHTYNGFVYIRTHKDGNPVRILSVGQLNLLVEDMNNANKRKLMNISIDSNESPTASNDAKLLKMTRPVNPPKNREKTTHVKQRDGSVSSASPKPTPNLINENPFRHRTSVTTDTLPARKNSTGTLDCYIYRNKETNSNNENESEMVL